MACDPVSGFQEASAFHRTCMLAKLNNLGDVSALDASCGHAMRESKNIAEQGDAFALNLNTSVPDPYCFNSYAGTSCVGCSPAP